MATTETTTSIISTNAPKIPTVVLRGVPTSTQPTPTLQQKPPLSPLLQLPGELRNIIYELLLTPPELTSQQRRIAIHHPQPNTIIHTAILSTCKQIHDEATLILYARNTFSAHPSYLSKVPHLIDPTRPVQCMGSLKRAPIRHWRVPVRLDVDHAFTPKDVADAFTGADSLEVECSQAQFEGSDYAALRLFEDVRGVGHARVSGSVEPGFAHWLELVMQSPVDTEEERVSGCSTPAYVECNGEDGRRAS